MNTPVPAPRICGEKKPIPAPRLKKMLSNQKSSDSISSASSSSTSTPETPEVQNQKTLSARTAKRVRSFRTDLGAKIESVRRLTRSFSISSNRSNNDQMSIENDEESMENGHFDMFNSIRFESPMNSMMKPAPEYTNWEVQKKPEPDLNQFFNLPPPNYPPPSLPENVENPDTELLYNNPQIKNKPVQRTQSNADAYESVYPFKKRAEEEADAASTCTEDTNLSHLTFESGELSRSSSWKFYDSVVGNLSKEIEEKLALKNAIFEEAVTGGNGGDSSDFSVEVRNSIYENLNLEPKSRPSPSVIYQFDPLLSNTANSNSNLNNNEEYKMLEELLEDDLYGNLSAHRTIDTWSLEDSEEDFVNPPSPPIRFDSLQETTTAATPAPIASIEGKGHGPNVGNSKNAEARKSWLKHVKDVVISSSELIKNRSKDAVQRPMVHLRNTSYKKGMLYKVQSGPVEDLFGEYSGRWCILENANLVCYSNNSCEHVKEHFPVDSVLSVEKVKHPKLKLKSDHYELFCFKITSSGKTRGGHVYGSRNASDRRLWMQTIAESLTSRFGTKLTSDYTRIGWTYVREGVTGKWAGAWLILSNRNLIYAVDGVSVKTLDLRKARCIALMQNGEDSATNPQTSDKGPNMLVDACDSVIYMRMWTTRETKIWCHLIKVAAHTNGAGLDEQQLTKNNIPVVVEKCINFIYLNGSMSKGIYRQSGVGSLVSELLSKFAEDAWAVQITNDKYSEHDVATALKRFFRDLPEPLLGTNQRQYFYQVSIVKNQEEQVRMYKAALDNLPEVSYKTAKKLLGHLYFIGSQHAKNFMNVINLAAIWGPTLMHFKTEESPQPTGGHQKDVTVIADLISLYKHIFPEDALEMEQEKVMLQILEKHAQSPQGAISKKNAGDFRIWIYLGDQNGETFNVAIGPNKTALEVCTELSSKVNSQVYEMLLEEVMLDGQLRRPIHHSEKILDIVLKWGYLDDSDRKNNYLVIGDLSKYSEYSNANHNSNSVSISGELKFADAKTKNFKSLNFELANGALVSYKDKIRSNSWKIGDISWYLGHESKRNPPHKWTVTFFLKNDLPKRSRNQPFFGNVLCWSDSEIRANWLALLLKTLYPDGLTQPLHVNLTS